ncbi:MAG TPA: chloride channel protein [Candidatus Aquilonibacter sp.]|nr:chloride channel protein [Candidatus Aquilonibacter sp.]
MPPSAPLRDFSTDAKRLVVLCGYAAIIGVGAGALAKLLLTMIGLFTHVLYEHDFGVSLMQPDPRHLGPIAILIPVLGGIAVGFIARFGTDKIRGHGIPEAIASILEGNSIIRARVAFWKPLASAITIGSGGPFGAEGPIIMTGGAFGSLFAQYLRLSSFERRTLLVSGAAAGMSATFGSPIAAVLIAVELLLFEWRPRSFIPVAVASFVALGMRLALIAQAPPFAQAGVHAAPSFAFIPWALLIGVAGGVVSMLMTKLVYWTEDCYARLPVHWMWWPAIGGLVVGVGGWFVPQALGVGYPTISAMVNGHLVVDAVLSIIVVKIVIWIASLSSGTSGGVLAPLLMIGAALGTIFAAIVPGHDAAACAIVGMAALMGGTMRAPFMGTIFALETTHAWGLAPSVFVGCIAATAFTVAFVPRSILTEKLARRGLHVAREYSVHPLELIAVRDVMRPPSVIAGDVPVILVDARVRAAADLMAELNVRALRVVDERGDVAGIIESDDLLRAWQRGMREERTRRRVRRVRNILTPN